MSQGDYLIQNQSFPSFRSDLNSTLEAINTSNSGTSRPSSAVAGTVWLDTTSATTPTLKFYDGADDISLATLDYTANTVNWLDSVTASSNVVDDTTPQLGGNLDVNGNSIVSVSNGNITFTPDGSGKVIIDGLSFPTADGTADQVLKTDGSGNLSFADASGGGTQWQSSIVTATTLTAVAGNGYWINTTSNACTVTLPASASVGDTIEFSDYARTWETNGVTLNQNSLNFQGSSTTNPIYNVNGQSVRIVYSGATKGWIPTSDDDVTDEAIPIVSTEYLVVAGGGGAATGGNRAGGGGAGGLLTNYGSTAINLIASNTYTVTVGDGGSGGGSSGTAGSNSVLSGFGITTITAIGGGNSEAGAIGADGGSGGGAHASPGTAGSGTVGQGNDGGTGHDPNPAGGGGGGGAGAVGGNAAGTGGAGDGGNGLANSITGSSVTYAGGGGGTVENASYDFGSGGTGGGGNGAHNTSGQSGTANLGGGGGSGWTAGGSGGKGVVILRLATSDYTGTTTGSPTVSTSGTDTILTFNSSGSYTA